MYNKVIQHGVACQPTGVEATKCTRNQHSDKRKQQGIDSTNQNKQEVASTHRTNACQSRQKRGRGQALSNTGTTKWKQQTLNSKQSSFPWQRPGVVPSNLTTTTSSPHHSELLCDLSICKTELNPHASTLDFKNFS